MIQDAQSVLGNNYDSMFFLQNELCMEIKAVAPEVIKEVKREAKGWSRNNYNLMQCYRPGVFKFFRL